MPEEQDEKKTAEIMLGLAHGIDTALEAMFVDQMGFVLLVFPFNGAQDGNGFQSNYISNADRENIADYLRNAADRLDKGADFTTIGNA